MAFTPNAVTDGSAIYPYNADNGSDFWGANGPTTVSIAPIIATTGGSPNTILAGTSGKKIVVVALFVVNAVAGTVQLQDSAATNLSGVLTLAANQSLILPPNKYGYFTTTVSGNGLQLVVTGTSNIVGGSFAYYLL